MCPVHSDGFWLALLSLMELEKIILKVIPRILFVTVLVIFGVWTPPSTWVLKITFIVIILGVDGTLCYIPYVVKCKRIFCFVLFWVCAWIMSGYFLSPHVLLSAILSQANSHVICTLNLYKVPLGTLGFFKFTLPNPKPVPSIPEASQWCPLELCWE